MAKKEQNGKKQKKITYKFTPKNEGRVELKGLYEPGDDDPHGEYESVPKEIDKVLEEYGFTSDDGAYIDCICPGDSMGLDEDLEMISGIVPLMLCSKLTRSKKGSKISWECSFDDGAVAVDKTIGDALVKAHALWNKVGRPVDGVKLEEALEEAVDKANEKRG